MKGSAEALSSTTELQNDNLYGDLSDLETSSGMRMPAWPSTSIASLQPEPEDGGHEFYNHFGIEDVKLEGSTLSFTYDSEETDIMPSASMSSDLAAYDRADSHRWDAVPRRNLQRPPSHLRQKSAAFPNRFSQLPRCSSSSSPALHYPLNLDQEIMLSGLSPDTVDRVGGSQPKSSSSSDLLGNTVKVVNATVEDIRESSQSQACLSEHECQSLFFLYRVQSAQRALVVPFRAYHNRSARYTALHKRVRKGNRRCLRSNMDKRQQGPVEHCPTWPQGRIPVEIFELIAQHLARDDVRNLRLVSREFERHVSRVLFATVVVPFDTELYGMLNLTPSAAWGRKGKGKGVPDDYHHISEAPRHPVWHNVIGRQPSTGHDLDVFRGFGPHIRKYGMSFDLLEDALAAPGTKSTHEEHVTFWGSYQWPFPQYRRFADRAGLETTADETPTMTCALSYLSAVHELALSIDSGLGWLRGPDFSLRHLVFKTSPSVFGESSSASESTRRAIEFWETLKLAYIRANMSTQKLKYATLWRKDFQQEDYNGNATCPFETHNKITIPAQYQKIGSIVSLDGHKARWTLSYFLKLSQMKRVGSKSKVVPNSLTKRQQEWLLETEWAQRAFIMSYMLSVVDNQVTFQNVSTLNIARLSSRFLPFMCRQDFWDAIPSLTTVVLRVIPDWRTVLKHDSGFVDTPQIKPSEAISPFLHLVAKMIARKEAISTLELGWSAGGERAEGVCARNKHVLPAPLMEKEHLIFASASFTPMLLLPHVQNLTLSNCWLTPGALRAFVSAHKHLALKNLTLDSVSLTADPAGPHVNAPNAVQIALQLSLHTLQFPTGLGHVHGTHPFFGITGHQGWMAGTPNGAAGANPGTLGGPLQASNYQPGQAQILPHPAMLPAHQSLLNGSHLPSATAPWQFISSAPSSAPTLRTNTWPSVLAQIFPRRASAESPFSQPRAQYSEQSSRASLRGLQKMTLRSCGYVKLASAPFDQTGLNPPIVVPGTNDPYFEKRAAALEPMMLSTSDDLLGTIVQWIDPNEIDALRLAWGMRRCWPFWGEFDDDPDFEALPPIREMEKRDARIKELTGWTELEREAVEFDGCAMGGTGRFSGVVMVERGDGGG